MISKNEFNIMTAMIENNNVSQRVIADLTKLSIGTVNKVFNDLLDRNYVDQNYKITSDGLEALKPYKVKNAVIMAAGFGSRLVPITLNTPKPLVRVKGERIIDSILDALINVGITDITIVRGYFKEQFDQLLYKYPTIKFIDNDEYNESNNITSVKMAKDLISNTYVFEGDLLIYNPKIIKEYQYETNYLGVPVELTNDWCFIANQKKVITKMQVGGRNCFHMFGVSYWTETDGKKLSSDIVEVFNMPGGKEKYWDQVALDIKIKNYNIFVRECTFDDLIEIDTYNELKAIDKSYI